MGIPALAQVCDNSSTHTHIIGVSRSEPHINHTYEKIAVLTYACGDTSSTCSSRMRTTQLMQ